MASLSTLDDHVVSRALIILKKQSDWKLWYLIKKQFATIKGVWKYCDPLTTDKSLEINSKPSDKALEAA